MVRAELDALERAYGDLSSVVRDRPAGDFTRPTRCAGWDVQALLCHLLHDAQRALVTFASPADGHPDVDRVTYWLPYGADAWDPAGAEADVAHAQSVNSGAAALDPAELVALWLVTSAAAVRAGRACQHYTVTTQGHVLTVEDFVATLVVEATVHHLDLVVELPGAAGPGAGPLALARETLTALLRAPVPDAWDDETLLLKGTGREPLDAADEAALGPAADRVPLLG